MKPGKSKMSKRILPIAALLIFLIILFFIYQLLNTFKINLKNIKENSLNLSDPGSVYYINKNTNQYTSPRYYLNQISTEKFDYHKVLINKSDDINLDQYLYQPVTVTGIFSSDHLFTSIRPYVYLNINSVKLQENNIIKYQSPSLNTGITSILIFNVSSDKYLYLDRNNLIIKKDNPGTKTEVDCKITPTFIENANQYFNEVNIKLFKFNPKTVTGKITLYGPHFKISLSNGDELLGFVYGDLEYLCDKTACANDINNYRLGVPYKKTERSLSDFYFTMNGNSLFNYISGLNYNFNNIMNTSNTVDGVATCNYSATPQP